MSIAPGFYWGLFIIKKNMCLNICLITKLYINFTKQLNKHKMTNFLNQLEAYVEQNPKKIIFALIIIAILGDSL
jgi:hypothetical protein